jgi:hypothetical protein
MKNKFFSQCKESTQPYDKRRTYFIPLTIACILFVSGPAVGYAKFETTGRIDSLMASVTAPPIWAPERVDISPADNSDIVSVTNNDVLPDPEEVQDAKNGMVRELIVTLKQQGTGNDDFDNVISEIYNLAKQETKSKEPFGYLDFVIDVPEEDQYGNIQIQDAVDVEFRHSDLVQINWDNFDEYMLLNLAYSHSENPDADGPPGTGSSDVYGSQEIIKPWCAQYGSIGAATFCAIFGY